MPAPTNQTGRRLFPGIPRSTSQKPVMDAARSRAKVGSESAIATCPCGRPTCWARAQPESSARRQATKPAHAMGTITGAKRRLARRDTVIQIAPAAASGKRTTTEPMTSKWMGSPRTVSRDGAPAVNHADAPSARMSQE